MYGALDISTSGMIAQRTRLEAISSNIANQGSYVRRPDGEWEPYRGRHVMFAPGDPSAGTRSGREQGVHVAELSVDQGPFQYKEDPTHRFAMQSGPMKGYVATSNINPVVEQVDAIEAIRSYEANVAAAEATKSMLAQALRMLA